MAIHTEQDGMCARHSRDLRRDGFPDKAGPQIRFSGDARNAPTMRAPVPDIGRCPHRCRWSGLQLHHVREMNSALSTKPAT